MARGHAASSRPVDQRIWADVNSLQQGLSVKLLGRLGKCGVSPVGFRPEAESTDALLAEASEALLGEAGGGPAAP